MVRGDSKAGNLASEFFTSHCILNVNVFLECCHFNNFKYSTIQ